MSVAIMETDPSPFAEVQPWEEMSRKLDLLSQNVQALGAQVQFLTDKAYDDRRRQQGWDDLQADLQPVIKDMYAATVEQLQEIQAYVELNDILALMKRLARSTRMFNEMLDQLESLYDLWQDVSPLTKEMVDSAVTTLHGLEQKGYFGFLRQSSYVLDQVVTSFDEEDVRQLGDNVVLILNTVKALTQPEMMNLIGSLTQGFHEAEAHPEELPTSLFGLLGQMRDPEVRRGLAITMAMLKRVSAQSPGVGRVIG
jgi:uncharacterized protein YjgD (DUF1641 family)